MDPRDPGTHIEAATSYQIALNREGANWLRAARNLIYHLSRLDDLAQARQTFTAIYFELFFWWGFYLRYPVLEEFVRDWQTMRQMHGDRLDEDDKEWFGAIQAFHQSYHRVTAQHSRRTTPTGCPVNPTTGERTTTGPPSPVRSRQSCGLPGWMAPSGALHEHDQWHTRALVETFLA